jgi:ABC-2 type transport system permease protein
MLASSRAGLDYYQAHFSPISSPNTASWSSRAIGISRSPSPTPFPTPKASVSSAGCRKDDIDLTYFVTAHELGHQWWGHQLIGGQVQGSNMMSETLAQYSAYMVMQEQSTVRTTCARSCATFWIRYLRGRAGETRHEPPLALVQREPYVWYEKGGQIMYTLADYIGEDKIDTALHNFLMQYRYANATNQVDAMRQFAQRHRPSVSRYPHAIGRLNAQTPAEYRYLVDDGFNRIVLYDNKAVSATSQKTADGKYKVTLDVQAHKVQADGNGAETRMPLADYIDIGVFSGKQGRGEAALHEARKNHRRSTRPFTIMVDKQPTRAGIDPYNKLIDRNADDNMIDVEKK